MRIFFKGSSPSKHLNKREHRLRKVKEHSIWWSKWFIKTPYDLKTLWMEEGNNNHKYASSAKDTNGNIFTSQENPCHKSVWVQVINVIDLSWRHHMVMWKWWHNYCKCKYVKVQDKYEDKRVTCIIPRVIYKFKSYLKFERSLEVENSCRKFKIHWDKKGHASSYKISLVIRRKEFSPWLLPQGIREIKIFLLGNKCWF